MSIKRDENKPIAAHPGAIIKRELESQGMSASALAMALGVPANRITALVNQKRGMTPDTAIRLAELWGGAPEIWIRMQAAYDLAAYEAEKGQEVRAQVRKPAA